MSDRRAAPDRATVSGLPIFVGLAADDLDRLLGEARLLRLSKGVPVFEQGADAHSFFVLAEGHLRVVRLTASGEQVIMRHIGSGEIFGIAAAIGRTTYPATAIPAVDGWAFAWPSQTWPRLAAEYPLLVARTLRTVGSRLQEAHTLVTDMSTQETERRVARALLRLADQAGHQVETGIEIGFPLSRRDVAEMTGTTLHTVSRILSAWHEQGLVGGGRQRIVLRDPNRLRQLANGAPP